MANRLHRKLHRDEDASALVEFAVVLPLLLMVTLGLIDLSLLLFNSANANRATQAGARCVATSAPVVAAIDGTITGTGVNGSDCTDSASGCVLKPTYSCTANAVSGGSCVGSGSAPTLTFDADADKRFDDIVDRMRIETFSNTLDRRQLRITYTPLPQGFIGRPSTPMNITVALKCTRSPMFTVGALVSLVMPPFPVADNCGGLPSPAGMEINASSTLPSEDLSGDCKL